MFINLILTIQFQNIPAYITEGEVANAHNTEAAAALKQDTIPTVGSDSFKKEVKSPIDIKFPVKPIIVRYAMKFP